MSEAPKKIWMAADDAFDEYAHLFDGDIAYIRADIVEEMRDALQIIAEFPYSGRYVQDTAQAALKRLEEE